MNDTEWEAIVRRADTSVTEEGLEIYRRPVDFSTFEIIGKFTSIENRNYYLAGMYRLPLRPEKYQIVRHEFEVDNGRLYIKIYIRRGHFILSDFMIQHLHPGIETTIMTKRFRPPYVTFRCENCEEELTLRAESIPNPRHLL